MTKSSGFLHPRDIIDAWANRENQCWDGEWAPVESPVLGRRMGAWSQNIKIEAAGPSGNEPWTNTTRSRSAAAVPAPARSIAVELWRALMLLKRLSDGYWHCCKTV